MIYHCDICAEDGKSVWYEHEEFLVEHEEIMHPEQDDEDFNNDHSELY